MLLHYLGKLINQNFSLFMHIKRVSNGTFYHLSNSYLSNIMKIIAKNVHHLHGHMPGDLFTFQQDSAPSHHARETIGLLQRETSKVK